MVFFPQIPDPLSLFSGAVRTGWPSTPGGTPPGRRGVVRAQRVRRGAPRGAAAAAAGVGGGERGAEDAANCGGAAVAAAPGSTGTLGVFLTSDFDDFL